MRTLLLLVVLGISGCCIDTESNAALGNIITYERGRVCVDSRQRGLASSGKICGRPCSKEK